MKNIIIIIALLWSIPSFSQIKSASLTASGLTCSMCSKAIYKKLEKIPFVKSVTADVEKSSYSIQFKDGANVVIDDILKAVQDAGFSVASMQVTAHFSNDEVFNDAHIEVGGSTFHFLNVPKQTLNSDKTVTILDKNYVSQSDRKKYAAYTKMKCFETGYMASCCPSGHGDHGTHKRVYHVTL
jgi:copper chaperone CopZ